MIHNFIFGLCVAVMPLVTMNYDNGSTDPQSGTEALTVKKCTDFEVTGNGSSQNWAAAEWVVIPQRSGVEMATKVKMLYSGTGMYFLFDCQDTKITSDMKADFLDLWTEDVVEVFLWPDEKSATYFEYEISPLNYELPILISNQKGDLVRWQPFHYDPDRKTRHATGARGGEKKSDATITGWTAEFFIPYKLMRPLENISPKSGTKWRSNFYRVDVGDKRASWSWQLTGRNFHDYEKFGVILFE